MPQWLDGNYLAWFTGGGGFDIWNVHLSPRVPPPRPPSCWLRSGHAACGSCPTIGPDSSRTAPRDSHAAATRHGLEKATRRPPQRRVSSASRSAACGARRRRRLRALSEGHHRLRSSICRERWVTRERCRSQLMMGDPWPVTLTAAPPLPDLERLSLECDCQTQTSRLQHLARPKVAGSPIQVVTRLNIRRAFEIRQDRARPS
ncbi:uncharacterized protein LOC133349580 [Lethenteron reissneri]|uniref:uncharacterized protein LOC133349580 n=1 Tax=Lethenteron reissneri TaxID=7753 RepID=UPI002AB71E1F|nr:uncharacterized protein LOC133349580 [Lethenteron reissneri]